MAYHKDNLKISTSKHELSNEFSHFSKLANDLTESYYELQAKVDVLTLQLAKSSQERLDELIEKERLAARLQHLLSLLPIGVIVLDGNGIIQECNAKSKELLNIALLGVTWRFVINDLFSPQIDDGHEVSLKDGRKISILTCSLGAEPGQIIVLSDLTQTRALQEQLSHDRHLRDMGKMIASLAHQIRTPLSTALLYAKQLSDSHLDSEKRQQFGDKLVKRLKYMEHQVQDMLVFAKGDKIHLRKIKAPIFIENLIGFICDKINDNKCVINIDNKIENGYLDIHEDMLIGAIQNIINNSLESTIDKLIINMIFFVEKENIIIKISDNGPGIPDEVINNIMKPFYTTRPQGTGLGLAVVNAVVKAHGGEVNIHSAKSFGTEVSILLPMKVKQ